MESAFFSPTPSFPFSVPVVFLLFPVDIKKECPSCDSCFTRAQSMVFRYAVHPMRIACAWMGIFLLCGSMWADGAYAPYSQIEATGWLKDAAVVLVESVKNFHLQKDGTTLLHEHLVWKVLSPAGVRAVSELRAFYADGETITALHAETINPEGVLKPTPEADKDLTAPVAQWAPIYTDVHVRSITMPAVKVGSVLVMDLEARYPTKEFPGEFWYSDPAFKLPVMHQSVRVEVPDGVHFNWFVAPVTGATSSDNPVPVVNHAMERRATGETDYQFEWKNLGIDSGEVAAPPPPPPFLFSTLANWSELGRWYWQLADPEARPDDAVRAQVAALTHGMQDDDARMRAIYSFVASRIRYVSLSFGVGAYRPHAAADVLQNSYGDCKDKAALLIAMLRAAGIEARFALVNTGAKVEPGVAAPAQFDHAIVAVPEEQGYLFLDPTSEAVDFGNLPADDADRDVFVVTADGGKLVRTPPVDIDQMATRETDQIQVTGSGDASVVNDYDLGFVDSAPARLLLREAGVAHRDEAQKALARAFDENTHLVKFSASDPDDLGHRMTMHSERRIDHVVHFDDSSPSLPLWWHLGGNADVLGGGVRHSPIVLTSLIPAYRQEIDVTLPAGYLPHLPVSKSVANDFARFRVLYLFNPARSVLHVEAEIRPLKQEIPASRTGECASFLRAVNDGLKSTIPLQLGSGASAESVTNTMRQVAILLSSHADSQAEQLARGILKAQPEHPTVRDSLAMALLDEGKFDDAAALLQEEVARFPTDLRAQGLLARADLKRKQLPAALSAVEAQLQKTPYDASMRALEGQICLQKSDAAGALKAYAEAIRIDPLHPDGYVGQGRAQLQLGHVDAAIQSFATAAGSDQVSRRQLQQMAQALLTAGIQLDVARTYAQRSLFLLQDQLNATRVEDLNPQGRQAMQDLPDLLRLLADLSARQKNFENALPMMTVAATMRPDDVSLLQDAADIALQAGKPQQALLYLATAVKAPGAGADLFVRLNQAYQRLPDHSLPLNVYLVKNADIMRVQCGPFEVDGAPSASDAAALIIHGGHASGSVLDRLNEPLREKVTSAHFADLQIAGRSITYAAGLSIRPPDTLVLVPLQFMENTK